MPIIKSEDIAKAAAETRAEQANQEPSAEQPEGQSQDPSAAEPQAVAPQPAQGDQPKVLPTLQELVEKRGLERHVAFGKLVNRMALNCGKSKEEAAELANLASQGVQALEGGNVDVQTGVPCDPYYKVRAKTEKDFWRIGRPFPPSVDTKVLKSSLTPKQIKELESSNRTFLDVVLVTHE